MNILFIDNFDSFSFNIVDDIKQLGATVTVVRNDISMDILETLINREAMSHIVISPGPGTPQQAGICIAVVEKYRGKIPVFGICLGFQALVVACGGKITQLAEPCHGKASEITYQNSLLMHDLPNPFKAGRYHSLAATTVTKQLNITAQCNGIPMAVENKSDGLFAVQFHPESILTPAGNKILANFFKQTMNQ